MSALAAMAGITVSLVALGCIVTQMMVHELEALAIVTFAGGLLAVLWVYGFI